MAKPTLLPTSNPGRFRLENESYVGLLESHFERPKPVCLRRVVADDRRRSRRVFARLTPEALVVVRRSDGDDDHGKRRRPGIRVGKGMVPAAEIPEANSPRRSRYDSARRGAGADSRSGEALVLACGPAVLRVVSSKRGSARPGHATY